MIGDELDRIAVIPDQPDADIQTEGAGGIRIAFLGTSPDVHAINTPVYRAEILPADAKFPPNGLPVFHLTWRNDDGGPGYGADSRLDFVAPEDGDYILHLKDVRDLEGPDYAYRLTIRDASPDYRLEAEPENPNIPQGGSIPISVIADRLPGYEGPIEIQVQGLPAGVIGRPGYDSGGTNFDRSRSFRGCKRLCRSAAFANKDRRARERGGARFGQGGERGCAAAARFRDSSSRCVGNGGAHAACHSAGEVRYRHAACSAAERIQGPGAVFGRKPSAGVRVVNVGLNGVLVTESQSSRTFTLRAEDWAKPITQPVYVVGRVESNSPTMHPSAPLSLQVSKGEEKESRNSMGSAGRDRIAE